MTIFRVFFICLFILTTYLALAMAHGDHGQVGVQSAITVTFTGPDGQPQAGLGSHVLGPDGRHYLTGQTDTQGRVVFLPDQAGEWTVKAMSEDGHGGSVKVLVGQDLRLVGPVPAQAHAMAPAENGMTFAAALGYLLGAFGVVALILARKGSFV